MEQAIHVAQSHGAGDTQHSHSPNIRKLPQSTGHRYQSADPVAKSISQASMFDPSCLKCFADSLGFTINGYNTLHLFVPLLIDQTSGQ
jgi:hypothetical protein